MLPCPQLLDVNELTKSYATVVLDRVNFDLRAGEVHALVGENGAGKSTLSRIIAGLTRPDSGRLQLRGGDYVPQSRKDAEHHGIRMVMQELNLVGTLSVAENLFMDCLPHRWGWIDYDTLNRNAREALSRVGLEHLDPRCFVSSLGIGQQQLVEIAAALCRKCDILILDEPTAALTQPEIERLFEQIKRLKSQGVGLIYISHRMEEIQRLADRVTVLRDGKVIATRAMKETHLEELVSMMVGRKVGETIRSRSGETGPVTLRVEGLRRGDVVRGVSFEAHQGEILGFAGLMGAGRTETMRLLFGADMVEAGEIYLNGKQTPVAIKSPVSAVRNGIAFLTENRKEQGLLLSLTVRENITLTMLRSLSSMGQWIRAAAEQDSARDWIARMRLRCHSAEQPVRELSGGNQQKAVVAKWLYRDCDILIFDEPTRGIDVGAKFEIYQLLMEQADRGKTVLVVSSDLKELLEICDRIVVMSVGKVAATFKRGEWTQDKIMAAALSGHLGKSETEAVSK